MSFETRLSDCARFVDAHLQVALSDLPDSVLAEAMRYAVTGGGKRLRAFLVLESAAVHDVPMEVALNSAAAIEAIHAFSLVHDDMPCMDDDDLRRGKPTVHKVWDEAIAVLAGDGLQSLAFELIAAGDLPADRKLELSRTLAEATGARGMAYGQAIDMAAESAAAPLTLDQITELQAGKTGALIEWSAMAGARMAFAPAGPLKKYAKSIGLAFQITDDILDVEGDEAKTGKRVGKDENAGKATFVSLLGLEGAKKEARELVAAAIDALCIYDARADHLRDAARFVISREF